MPSLTSYLRGLVVLLLAGVSFSAHAHADATEPPSLGSAKDACVAFDHEHVAWTALLSRYVQDGFVDYTSLARERQPDLDRYLHAIAAVCRTRFDAWSRAQKLAFWINAYNAYTVRLILDHQPLESIRSIGVLPGAAFRKEFIPSPSLRGRTLSLNDIEHEILRKEFQEPRIHFAIVCASKSCPSLRSEAYRAPVLEQQLDEAARGFVRDESKNRFDVSARKLRLSSIFKWFSEDFQRAARTVPEFVTRYVDEASAVELRSGNVSVEFLDYDWSLNGK